MYQLLDNGVVRESDGAHIPDDIGNKDWQEYIEWSANQANVPGQDMLLINRKTEKMELFKHESKKDKLKPVSFNGNDFAGNTETLDAILREYQVGDMAGASEFPVDDINGTTVMIAGADGPALVDKMSKDIDPKKQKLKAKKAEVDSAQTVADVEAINW